MVTTTPPSITQTPTRKRKLVDQHAGSSHTRQHAQPHARDPYHAQAPQANPVTQNATLERGDINGFLKEALATVLLGNEELRMIVEQHASVAHDTATKIYEIVMERDGIMPNVCDLTAQFCEMQKKYRGPGQISLSSLAVLKERLGAKSGTPSTTQPNNADR